MTMLVRVLSVLVCLAAPVWAGDLALEPVSGGLPPELPAELAEALLGPGYSVSEDGRPLIEIWFPKAKPTGGNPGAGLGINFGEFPVGALLGVVRITSTWYDYKNLPIPPGIYVLRYGQQPADGNHTGITYYRDYAMLIPLEQDRGHAASYSQKELNQLSKAATRTVHPGVMALFPVWDPVEGVQIVPNELDQPTLVWHFDQLAVGFVLQGHGELEGY